MNDTATSAPVADRPHLPWWTSPAGLTMGFLLPVLFLIAYVGEANISTVTIRGTRFLTLGYIELAAVFLLVIALSGWFGARLRLRPVAPANRGDWDRAAVVVGSIALLAYAVWFKDYLLSPSLLLQTLLGAIQHERSESELTPGLTSLANFAPAFFSLYAFRVAFPGPRITRAMHLLCAVMIPVTVFRVYVWQERLAFIEATVPFALAAGAMAIRSRRTAIRALVLGGPFVALPGLVLYFGAAEYVRSWASPTYSGKTGFWDFAIGRIASYYYTSFNNGAGALATTQWPTYDFENTLSWLHRAPFGIGPQFSALIGFTHSWGEPFLYAYGDPEFNSPSGIYAVICEMGVGPAMGYFAVVAVIAGMLSRAYGEGRLIGAALYPIFFMSLLEIFRYPYLGTPRAFTWTLGVGLVLLLLLAQRRAGDAAEQSLDAGEPRTA